METEITPDESVSTAVVRAASAVTGREPDSLKPLTDVIDPDALDTLFAPRANDVPRTGGRLSFTYSNCRITIDTGEILFIEPFETPGRLSAPSDETARAEPSRSGQATQQTVTEGTPGSRVCFVCQQPIDRKEIQREGGELVHLKCRAELRCGISLETWYGRRV